ncbi:MAG: dihydropteroate synthase [Bacteroidetes bacterium]|nr:dihydropteroate synthase [Bacteroidota bacterium]
MTFFKKNRTLNCKGRLVEIDRPKIMGILNVTPDSFYDGGKYSSEDASFEQAQSMLKEGADIIDIGGMSTRPGAEIISVEEEMARVIPVINRLHAEDPEVLISIDTVHSETARASVAAGASIVNDISAGTIDPKMLSTVAELKAPYVLMHMKGKPEDMQNNPLYTDAVLEILDFLIERVRLCREAGITDIIVDPGLGFGKRLMDNYAIIQRLEVFDMLELPVLIGASRKSMISKLLDVPAGDTLNGSTAVHMAALLKGVDILRVHDVREARQCIIIYEALKLQANK